MSIASPVTERQPIYGLNRALKMGEHLHVVALHSAEACEAHRRLDPDSPCIALIGPPDPDVDMSVFAGRYICAIPSAGEEAIRHMRGWAALLIKMGAHVSLTDYIESFAPPDGDEDSNFVPLDSWDAAAAENAGWCRARFSRFTFRHSAIVQPYQTEIAPAQEPPSNVVPFIHSATAGFTMGEAPLIAPDMTAEEDRQAAQHWEVAEPERWGEWQIKLRAARGEAQIAEALFQNAKKRGMQLPTPNSTAVAAVKIAGVVPLPPLGPRQNTTELRLALWRNGYLPVPVSGPAMNVKSAGKRPLMKGWETICANPTEDEIVRWAKGERNCTNTGLLCGVPSDGGILGGADIDVPVPHLAEEIARVAVEILGNTPLRRIGAAPKTLLCYRLTEEFEKVQTPDLLLENGTKVKVEFLASGQQFVGFGVHPGTKKSYSWPARDPIDVPLADLPTITPRQARAFVAKAESILRGAGAETKAEKNKQAKDGLRAAGIRRNMPVSAETVREALSFIPNADLDYDSWVKIGLALYAGLGEAGRQLWDDWSAQSSKNDAAFTADKWPSFAGVRLVSIGTIFWEAQQSGWRRGARRLPQLAQTQENGQQEVGVPIPAIKLVGGKHMDNVDQAEAALMAAGTPIFRHGGVLVIPVELDVMRTDGRTVTLTRLAPVLTFRMMELMTSVAVFEMYDKRSAEWLEVNCPKWIADTYLARCGAWRLRPLNGVITTPTLRWDGSVLETPGYDPSTRLFFQPGATKFAKVPNSPTKEDAAGALETLKGLLCEFPFVTPVDRAVALSLILTAVIRQSIPSAPLHAVSAHAPGTGKSFLVELATLIAHGHIGTPFSQGKTDEEFEKRLDTALIAGDGMIHIDNCDKSLESATLCVALTQESMNVRILGLSKNVEVLNNALITATGNNMVINGDLTRRTLMCNLDAQCERPELRKFAANPTADIKTDRGTYAVAALTVLRAYSVAGRTGKPRPLLSFEEWSNWVRGALIWLGEADPVASMEDVRKGDQRRAERAAVLEHWHRAFGSERVTVKHVISTALRNVVGADDDAYFRAALMAVAGRNGEIDNRRLGNWLSANTGVITDGRKIIKVDEKIHGNQQWSVAIEQVGYGGSGVSISPLTREDVRMFDRERSTDESFTDSRRAHLQLPSLRRMAATNPTDQPDPPTVADLAPGEEVPL